jgi:hypothetical protein
VRLDPTWGLAVETLGKKQMRRSLSVIHLLAHAYNEYLAIRAVVLFDHRFRPEKDFQPAIKAIMAGLNVSDRERQKVIALLSMYYEATKRLNTC